MKKSLPIALGMILSASAALAAGGEGSVISGGELFRDAKNPWFVRNLTKTTYTVRYCVQVDTASFSASPERVRVLVEKALAFWKDEFSRGGGADLWIARQNFVESECSDQTDLAFKFGYGTLTPANIEELKKPKRYIGVSVRTSYNPVELRGKGYIFVASDMGPNAYDNPGTLIERAWQHERLLQYALLHELGHVFGLTHSGAGLMSEVFFDQLLNKALYSIFLESPIETFFLPPSPVEVCGDPIPFSGAAKVWLGVPMDTACVRMETDIPGTQYRLSYRLLNSNEWKPAGVIASGRQDIFDVRDRPAVYLQLNPEQKVFPEDEADYRSFMTGPLFVDFGADALYTPTGASTAKSCRLRVTSGSLQIVGQQSGKVIVPYNYNSLIGVKMTIPPPNRK